MSATDLAALLNLLGALFLLAGAFFTLVAALGLVRLPDLLARMHAATKPQTLGLTLVAIGVALSVRTVPVTWALMLVVAFQMITAPISAHMVSRSAYRTGALRDVRLAADEMMDDLRAAEVALAIEEHGRATAHETRLDAEGS